MSLTITIASVSYPIHVSSFQTQKRLNQPSTCTFVVEDSTAALLYQKQRVSVTETTRGVLFSGFVDTLELLPIVGSTRSWAVTCLDKTYLANKWYYTRSEYLNRTAGDIVADVHANYLAQEGLLANYVQRHDYDSASFGAGTLTNTNANNGDIELALGGVPVTLVENTNALWNAGTLTKTVAVNNALTLTSSNVMKFTATAVADQNNTNLFSYRCIWQGAVTIADGDIFSYDVWNKSTNPDAMVGMELLFSDNTDFRDLHYKDENGYNSHPGTDITAKANDQWYSRQIVQVVGGTTIGKTINRVLVGFESDKSGSFTAYFRNAVLTTSTGTVKATFFNGSLTTNYQNSTTGYYGSAITVVKAYDSIGTRLSPAYSIANVGILKNTLLSWYETDAPASGSTNTPQVLIEATSDGGVTWATCTNHQPIPFLVASMMTAGKTLQLRQTLSVQSSSPELAPVLTNCNVTLLPTYAATKSDIYDTDNSVASFAGTLSNVEFASGALQLISRIRNYDVTPDFSSQPLYGYNPSISMDKGNITVRCDQSQNGIARLDWMGTWTDFTCEYDMIALDALSGDGGIVYNTSGWGTNENNTYAYMLTASASNVSFHKGSNGGANSDTSLANVNFAFIVGNWYHFTLVKSGSTHAAYIDGIQVLTMTDSTYSSLSGYIGLRHYAGGTNGRTSGYYNHVGVQANSLTGVYTSNSVSLASVGTVETSYITWDEVQNTNTIILVETQVDGATWQVCTNGGSIPNLPYNMSLVGVSLRHRITYTTYNANATPKISGMTLAVYGKYSASGTRVSPVLSINSVGRIGSSSVTWIENTPTGTTTFVDTSPDNVTWTQATNGQPVPGTLVSPLPSSDDYTTNTGANYSVTSLSGGSVGTYSVDTTNMELDISGGVNALYVWNTLSLNDGRIDTISRQSENSGLIARYQNVSNMYYVSLNDASSSTNPNTVTLYKVLAGVVSTLSSASIVFPRGTYHALTLTLLDSALVVLFDGVALITVTDTSFTAVSGKSGFYSNGHAATYTMLHLQPQEDNAAGRSYSTRVRFTSTNTQVTPQVLDLALCVRGLTLATGAVIPLTQYSYTRKIGDILLDVAKKSNLWTDIDDGGNLLLLDKKTRLAPFPLSTINGDILRATMPKLTFASPKYRNRQYVTGAFDTQIVTEQKLGNGVAQSWSLKYPVQSITTMTVNTQLQTVGIAGTDVGRNFYYTPGSVTVSQEITNAPLASDQTLSISYLAQIPYIAQNDNVAQQTLLASYDGSTGIVVECESLPGGTRAEADQLAAARTSQYALLTRSFSFSTLREGLGLGNMTYIFAPEFSIQDGQFLITDITASYSQKADLSLFVQSDITCVDGEIYANWADIFVNDV